MRSRGSVNCYPLLLLLLVLVLFQAFVNDFQDYTDIICQEAGMALVIRKYA